jgi:hypothetical protein
MSLKSVFDAMWPGMLWVKLGQPVPLSNFASALNRGRPQAEQMKVPDRFSLLSWWEKGRSVASSNSTANWSGGRIFRHSSFGFERRSTGLSSDGT